METNSNGQHTRTAQVEYYTSQNATLHMEPTATCISSHSLYREFENYIDEGLLWNATSLS